MFFQDIASRVPEYAKISNAVRHKKDIAVSGLGAAHKAHFIAALRAENNNTQTKAGTCTRFLALVETEAEAVRLAADINLLSSANGGVAAAVVVPEAELSLVTRGAKIDTEADEFTRARAVALSSLAFDADVIAVATVMSAAQYTVATAEVRERSLVFEPGKKPACSDIAASLVKMGYTRVETACEAGEFAVRGGIVDICAGLPGGAARPLRVELWGDEVDTVSVYDTVSQRRVDTVKTAVVSPLTDLRGSGTTLFDYADVIVYCERDACLTRFKNAAREYEEELTALVSRGQDMGGITHPFVLPALVSRLGEGRAVLCFDTFGKSSAAAVDAVQLSPWNGELKTLLDDFKNYQGCAYAVFAGTEKAARTLADDLRAAGVKADFSSGRESFRGVVNHVSVFAGTLSGGFYYAGARAAVFTLYSARGGGSLSDGGGLRDAGKPRKKKAAIQNLDDLATGDAAVHDNYGVGIFDGVVSLSSKDAAGNDVAQDYIKMKYHGNDVLYVPVTQLDMLTRYVGNSDTVKLSRLHTDNWAKAKAKAKKAAEEFAEDLIEIYKERAKTKGHAFNKDGVAQVDFENHFAFVETDDQAQCAADIKADMETTKPMDRLLCGDVGFGKTEVALRAAFKCVSEGFQCALLCPTTVLAWQHYQTALRRFAGCLFNKREARVELLSRFRGASETREVLRKISAGEVDFVIGTHRIVQKDVAWAKLGLAIIDEEQRFGVAHKDKFKELYPSVDVLTLSATPIPRTLNMAMTGLRDMSVIETPPHDRQPVTTYVLEQDEGVVSAALTKEMRRGGQIYYIHNRVETILDRAAALAKLVPEARIGVAHGKMLETELLSVWRKLLEREIDILVCTTLIETGVDVPNCNTLIIENADCMGLAQLHQLRGRVGRTNRRAYAYFMWRRGKVVSEEAEKRLAALREYTAFGSGFRVALRDLEIRGAGSVLGRSQSGNMSAVGFNMYVQMLENAVKAVSSGAASISENEVCDASDTSGVKITPAVHETALTCAIDLKMNAFIPDTYVSSATQRVKIYRRIANIKNDDDASDVIDELCDRFGEPPRPVTALVDAALARNYAAAAGYTEITQNGAKVTMYCNNMESVMKMVEKAKYAKEGRFMLNFAGKTGVVMTIGKGEDVVREVVRFLRG